ncbi:MAG TPA: hypothetical protein VJU17_05235, partial [Gemmatimonadales bacterium]|nr:hypothetical protein [Gemmatimonadales bacterium]
MLLGIASSALLMSLWAQIAYGNVGRGLNALTEPGSAQTIVAGSSQLLGFAFATWVIGFRVLRLDRADLRWFRPRAGAPGMVTGLALGAGAAAVALLAAVLVANSHWSRDTGSMGDYLGQVCKTSLVLAP